MIDRPMAETRLLLVDAMGIFYRAFFAIRNMTAPDGSPTNGVFGFIRLIDQMRKHWQPTHVAVAFEGGIPQYRLALVPEYKANRPSMPDDMRVQIPLLQEYLDCAGLCRVEVDGWEADDVMAALAVEARGCIDDVLLATSDKDLMQLVGDGISMVTVSGTMGRLIPADVEAKMGVPPAQIVDWLAMVGDSADNIPGIKGVGPKTATRLLKQFGSIAAMYERLDEVESGTLRAKLEPARDRAMLNRDMVQLHLDMPGLPAINAFAVSDADASALLPFYDRLGFKSMAQTLRAPELF